MRKQGGYFLVLAVILIFVMGVMGSLMASLLANRAKTSVSLFNGLQSFYIAESGLEAATRYITRPKLNTAPTRISCAGVTGNAQLTAASMATGQFTATSTTPSVVITSLSSAITASALSITVANASSLASQGRILIDHESIDYAAKSSNTLLGVTRGVDGSLASSHASGTAVSQYQCNLVVNSAVPTIASPKAERQLQWGVQLQDGMMVGDRNSNDFVVFRWNGETELTWANDSYASGGSAFRGNLNSVSMLSNADGFAVGDRATTGSGTFIVARWNGSTWTTSWVSPACSGQNLNGVSAVSAREAWAVGVRYISGCGGGSNYRYTFLKWNGSSWSLLAPTTIPADSSSNQNLNAVHVISTNNDNVGDLGFAVGNSGVILRYNGTTWTAMTSSTTSNLFGVFVVSASEAWAVGASGDILRWNGSSWSLNNSTATQQLNAISMVDTNGDGLADFGVAVGNSGRIMVYNGSTWSAVSSGSANYFAVGVIDENDAWVAGASGNMSHWDGSTWTTSKVGVSVTYNGMSLVAPKIQKTTGWAQVFN